MLRRYADLAARHRFPHICAVPIGARRPNERFHVSPNFDLAQPRPIGRFPTVKVALQVEPTLPAPAVRAMR